jgi:hypothetical protein
MKKVSAYGFFVYCCVTIAQADQCSDICKNVKDGLSLVGICAKELRRFPRPKVGQFCKDGATRAFEDVCLEFCESASAGGQEVDRHRFKGLGLDACKHAEKILPRPNFMRACLNGYNNAAANIRSQVMVALKAVNELPFPARPFGDEVESFKMESSQILDVELSITFESSNSLNENVRQSSSEYQELIVNDNEDIIRVEGHQDGGISMVMQLDDRMVQFEVKAGEDIEKAVIDFCYMYMSREHDQCIKHVSKVVQSYYSAQL